MKLLMQKRLVVLKLIIEIIEKIKVKDRIGMKYKIPNSLRLTIGDKKENEHFIKAIKEILN